MDATQNRQTAIRLAELGYYVFPCESGGDRVKAPKPFFKWASQSSNVASIVKGWFDRWPDAAIGLDLARSGFLVIDCDRHGNADGVEAFGGLMDANGFNPDIAPLVATPNNGVHYYFRQRDGESMGNARGDLPPGIDVRGAGGYVIAPGTIMADGRQYEAHGDIEAATPLPDWLRSIIAPERKVNATVKVSLTVHAPTGQSEIEELLFSIHPDCSYEDWLQALMAVHAATGGSDSGLSIADSWSSRGSKYKVGEVAAKWRSFKRSGINLGTLAKLAQDNGADLSAIAIKHGKSERDYEYDPIEAAEAARRFIESDTVGELIDMDTGEVVSAQPMQVDESGPDYPPGLVGEIAQWIDKTGRRYQPELSIGASLTIVGVACGRHICGPTMAGTALYVLSLAPTGTGKDHALKRIPAMLEAAGIPQHIGAPEFASMTAAVNMIKRKPVSLCAMDEFGDAMRKIYSRKASPHERAITKIYRTMWSANMDIVQTPEWAGLESETITAPHMSIYGVSTHEQFYGALEGGAVADGTLNRFLLVEGRKRPLEVNPDGDGNIVPDRLSNALRAVYFRSGELSAALRLDPNVKERVTVIGWCPDGSEAHWKAFSHECHETMISQPDRADFVVRSAEMAIRVATIIAVGDGRDSVRIGDVKHGIKLAKESADFMISGATEWMAENDFQAHSNRILRAVRDRGRISHSDLLRKLSNIMKGRELRDIIAGLIESGYISKEDVETKAGKRATWYSVGG